MGLETGTYISDLVSTNPVGATDPKSQGDDHIRLIKATLLATFPNIDAEMSATEDDLNLLAGAVAGNALTLDLPTLTLGPSGARITLTGTEIDLTGTALDFNGAVDISGQLTIANAAPILFLDESDANTDEGSWRLLANGGVLFLAARNDAGSNENYALRVLRSAESVIEVELNATLLDFNGALELSSYGLIGGAGSRGVGGSAHLTVGDGSSAGYISATDGTHDCFMGGDAAGGFIGTFSVHDFQIRTGNSVRLTFNNGDSGIFTPNLRADEVGYKGMPVQSQTGGSYTCVLSDAGRHILAGGGFTYTIPANASVAYPVGTVLTFCNVGGASSCSIAITTDSMYLAGTLLGTTGTRTLASGGIATALKFSSTSWIISGVGLS